MSLVTHILHSTDVCERTREELGNLSSFTSSATLLFAASKFWQRTDSFELQYYLGRPCALLTLIRTRISNAILHFLTLRHLGMLGLDQQWQGSSWWSSRLLEKWWSRGIVLKTVLRHRLEQVDTVWIFYAFTSIDGYCLSESAKLAFLQEIFVRGHCPWPNHLEGTVSWWEGSLFPFFPFSFSMIFIFFLHLLSPKGSWAIKAAFMYWGGILPFNITIIPFCWSQQKVPGVIPMLRTFHVCPTATYIC